MRFILAPSPLLGPASWDATARGLRALGHDVVVARPPALLEITGDYYPTLAQALAREADDDGRVLVAHSGAGALIPSVLAAAGERVEGVIFVDAILPHPGRSWFDTAPPQLRAQLEAGAQQGLLPAWDGWWPPGALERLVPDEGVRATVIGDLEPLPMAYFEEVAPLHELTGPAAYLQLSGAYEEEARRATRLGWPVVRLPLNHLATVTQGPAVAGAIETLAAKLRG